MKNQFRYADLDASEPFNNGDITYYSEEDMRRNPLRVQWVKDHIDNPPVGQSKNLTEFYQAWYAWATATTRIYL